MNRLISYLTPGFPVSLFESIGRIIGARVQYETRYSGPVRGSDPFIDDGAQLAWVCSTSFVDMANKGDPSVQLVGVAWVPDDPDAAGRAVYFGDVVTRPDSGITTFDDLRGKRVGCNDPVSLSGYYSLMFELDDRGLDEDYLDVIFTGGHQASLTAVCNGELDAAIVDSIVRTARERVDSATKELVVIERLGPWPVQALIARGSMSRDELATVRERLLGASCDGELRDQLETAALSHLTEVSLDHYAPVQAAMNRLNKRKTR